MVSIFKKSNPVIEKVFESSGSPRKVLIVPLDYAKKTHTALFCNGDGQRLKAPFSVHNTPEGISFLLDRVEKICRKHTLKPEHVIFAGEDGGSFSFNFIHALATQGETSLLDPGPGREVGGRIPWLRSTKRAGTHTSSTPRWYAIR